MKGFYDNILTIPFWTEEDILIRRQIQERLLLTVKNSLLGINQAWKFFQIEGPILTPRTRINESYTEMDVWVLQGKIAENEAVLRPETTPSSYAYLQHLLNRGSKWKLPVCIWQIGKSFRREMADGANAAKLRFQEFYQLEFQCIYSVNTRADYRERVIQDLILETQNITRTSSRSIMSERIPEYSKSTIDIECQFNNKWREVASISIRNDCPIPDTLNLEIAFGLDRLVVISNR